MNDDPPKPRSQADAELEREIRAERTFSLEEAIGRMAGPGAMKGVSPISRKRQAEMMIQEYLDQHLADGAGVLPGVLLRQVTGNEQLLHNLGEPLAVLAGHVQHILDSAYLLSELVRQADVEWGRMAGERPHFEQAGCQPHPDDPYTVESVHAALSELVGKLTKCSPKDQALAD